jgi:hypothetical protein
MEVNGKFHTPTTLTPRKNPQYSMKSRLGGPQSWSGRFWGKENPLSLSKFEHHTIQPTDSHYNNYAIPTLFLSKNKLRK